MYAILFIVLQLIVKLDAHDDNFVQDYFKYKNVRYVVGFSCNDITHDANLMRSFNSLGMYALIKQPGALVDIREFLQKKHRTLGVFVDMRCRNEGEIERIFTESSKYRMYTYLHNWLILGTTYNESVPLLNDTSYMMVTDLVLSIPNQRGFDMYEAFNFCKYRGGRLNVTKLGTWSPETDLDIWLSQPMIKRRNNLHGMRLKSSVVLQYMPEGMRLEDYLKDLSTRNLDSMDKFAFAILNHISEFFNFSFQTSRIIWWDKKILQGTILTVLQKNLIDFSVTLRVMRSERYDFAQPIGPAWPIRPCFMLLSAPVKKVRLEIFLKPFTMGIWYVSAVLTILASIMIIAVMKQDGTLADEQIDGVLLHTIGIMCQQGTQYEAKHLAGRLVLVQLIIFSWIMFIYYSGSLVSARLSNPFEKVPDSSDVLLERTDLKLAAEGVAYLKYVMDTLQGKELKFRRKRWDPLPQSERILPLEDGLRRVSEETMAYHTDPNTAYPILQKLLTGDAICRLVEIHVFKPSLNSIFSSHNGQFVEMGKLGLTTMFETGIRLRNANVWGSQKPSCDMGSIARKGVTIYEVGAILILLILGVMVSTTICIVENIVYRRSTRVKVLKNIVEREFEEEIFKREVINGIIDF